MASLLRSPLPPKASEKPLPQFDLGPLPTPDRSESVAARSAAPAAASKAGRTSMPSHAGTLAWATRLENAALGRLSPAMRERVGRHRNAVLVGGCVAGGVLLLALGLGARALVGGHDATARVATAPKEAPPSPVADPATARAATTATSAPAPAAADEPSVLLALAASLLDQHRDVEVPPLAARLLARHPELVSDDRLEHVVLAVASSNDARAVTDAFALLTGPMGETGAGLVYALALKSDTPKSVRARAQSYLSSKDFERVASLPVYAAEKLRSAKSCEDKRGLLDFAGQVGGGEVLDYLKELEQKTTCGADDLEHCYPCLASDHRLADTIAKLEHH
ncbi:MAG TPA: hypothetical protein VMI54_06060 [Polyangiaceae bacterium]|nr:hypothetical protein [Polyangiaceae bacterium]